jgi:thioredoxin 1
MIELTKENFEKEVLQSKVPVVVDFWATWCGPCRIFSPIIEDVSKEYAGKIKFAKLDVDSAQEIASKYNIMSIPTVLLFTEGKTKAMSVGAIPKESLKSWINKNL